MTEENIGKKDIVFQVLDWNYFHSEEINGERKFNIRLFGLTDDKSTIYVEVTDFTPYFYVRIPEHWNKQHITRFINVIKEHVAKGKYPQYENALKSWTLEEKCTFEEFTNYKKFKFLRLLFADYDAMKTYAWMFERPIRDYMLSSKPLFIKRYESNIEPIIRCMHCKDLQSCGWINIGNKDYESFPEDDQPTYCNINVRTKWTSLQPIKGKESDISPYTIAAFDIECISEDGSFPQAKRMSDKVIMIATTFSRYGENECFYKHAVVLGSCNQLPDTEIECCETEEEVLIKWAAMIRRRNPDFVTGWNIFGFDELYIKDRSIKLGIEHKVARLSRVFNEQSKFIEKKLASSALGDNLLKYYDMTGRVHYDLMKVVQRDFHLDSYKLDSVASYFFRDVVTTIEHSNNTTILKTIGTKGLKDGNYIIIQHNDGVTNYDHMNGKKFRIASITSDTITIDSLVDLDILTFKNKIYWCLVKDDVKPKEIKEKFNGTIDDRTELVKYNIQDSELCNKLTAKLQVVTNNVSMAIVCHVPLTYLFMRGQGVKIFSLVSRKCRERNHLVPLVIVKKQKEMTEEELKRENKIQHFVNKLDRFQDDQGGGDDNDEDEGFEGARVITPTPGVYYHPIMVLDFNSLYPNSMIYGNFSHECLVKNPQYMNLQGYKYETVTYDVVDINTKEKTGNLKTCMYAKKLDGTPGILPEILQDLLSARARVRKMMETEKDPFKLKVLDGLQLAYKITANSLYGQTGASTSPIRKKAIAACTTATGRNMLDYSCHFINDLYGTMINLALENKEKYLEYMKKEFEKIPDKKFDREKNGYKTRDEFFEMFYAKVTELLKGYSVLPKVIYGDTDSVFVDMNIKDVKTGLYPTDVSALDKTIKLGVLASTTICALLPEPMVQAYEKTLWPFMILSKKRYVGNLYEQNTAKFFQKSMGIALKRRDSCQIVKIILAGIVNWILNKRDPQGAVNFTREILHKILSGKFSIDKFIISKTLRDTYKKDKDGHINIAHYQLAQRMGIRDPGNKPASNDRIPYVYVETMKDVKLQGDRIETPQYVKEHNLHLDYVYYIEHQIMKPAIQFLELVVQNPEKIFEHYIMREMNRRKGVRPITSYI